MHHFQFNPLVFKFYRFFGVLGFWVLGFLGADLSTRNGIACLEDHTAVPVRYNPAVPDMPMFWHHHNEGVVAAAFARHIGRRCKDGKKCVMAHAGWMPRIHAI